MRILHVSDLHGSKASMEKVKELYFERKADLLVVSGDLTGKCVSNGNVSKCVWGRKKDPRELGVEGFENRGGYLVNVEDKEIERNAPGLLAQASAERVKEWLEDLEASSINFFVIPGNVDHFLMDTVISKFVPKSFTFKGLVFGRCSTVPFTPFGTYREGSEEVIERALPKFPVDVLVSHSPPKGYLDLSNYHGGGHVGSEAVLKWIKENQPLLGLHGHIHESPGVERLGKSTLVNPGSEAEHGTLRFAIIDLDGEMKVTLNSLRLF